MLFLVFKLLIVWSEWKEIVIIGTIRAAIVAGFCSLSLVTFADGPGEDGKGCPGGHSDESLILKHGIYRTQMNGWFGSLLVNNQTEWFENQLIVICDQKPLSFWEHYFQDSIKGRRGIREGKRHVTRRKPLASGCEAVSRHTEPLGPEWDVAGLPLQSSLTCSMSASATGWL